MKRIYTLYASKMTAERIFLATSHMTSSVVIQSWSRLHQACPCFHSPTHQTVERRDSAS